MGKDMDIAIKLSKDKSCIYRCIHKNNVDGKFIAEIAYEKIRERRLSNKKPRRILPDSVLAKYVVDKIEEYWSPEQIANNWKQVEKESLSHETIYQYLYLYSIHSYCLEHFRLHKM